MTSSPSSGYRTMADLRGRCIMGVVVFLVLSTFTLSCAATGADLVSVPPEITEHPPPEVAFKSGEPVTLRCRAAGSAELTYMWKLNGEPLTVDPPRGIIVQPDGSLELTKPDNGTYQCFVSNNFGTAVSVKSSVKAAVLERFTSNRVEVIRVAAGKPAKLKCEPPASYPTGNIYWGVHGNDGKLFPVENSDRRTLDYEGSLHFTNVLPSDNSSSTSSPFVCVVYNPLLRSLVQGSDQRIEVLPGESSEEAPSLVWSSPSTAIAIKGTLLRMKCIFAGHPTPLVTWARLGDSASQRSFLTNSSYGQELIISQVDFDDAGRYACSATNAATKTPVKHEFQVIVESTPYWKQNKMPANIDAMEEDDIRFECQVSGSPAPTVVWSINGVPVNSMSSDPRRTVGPDFLAYTNVTKTDTEVVQCNASNTHGYIFANAYLRVRAEPPSIFDAPDDEIKKAKGQAVILPCRATGAPIPKLSWSKNSELLVEEPDRIIVHASGNLEIKDASFQDAGEYTCTVVNKFGVDSVTSRLTVLDNMALVNVPQSEDMLAASPVELRCVVTVDPREQSRLKVSWLKDETPLDNSIITTTVSSGNETEFTLLIPESRSSDTGLYKCVASTDVETVEHVVQLLIKDRPNPPFNIEFTDCKSESRSTTVSFTPGDSNNEPITNFTVFMRSSNPAIVGDENDDQFQVAFNVSAEGPFSGEVQLDPWRNYTFYAVARNSIGTSDDSEATSQLCSTPPALPDANPSGVCSRQLESNQLVIVWQPIQATEVNGERFGYVVTYKQVDIENGEDQIQTVYGVEQSQLIIPNQEPFRQYEVYVQSINEVGLSYDKPERVIVHSGQDLPKISPTNLRVVEGTLDSTKVELAWDAVDQNEVGVNGFLIGYSVTYWNEDAEDEDARMLEVAVGDEAASHEVCWVPEEEEAAANPAYMPSRLPHRRRKKRSSDVTDKSISASIADLWPYANISASVAIINPMGVGVSSEPITITTPQGVPSPVGSVWVTECGSTHMKLTWSSPDKINGVLAGYTVKYVDSDGNTWEKFVFGNDITIYDLEYDSSYDVAVCAATAAGCGEVSTVEQRTLPDAPPDKPSVDNIALGESWANVSWKVEPAASSSHPASEHYIEIREESSKLWQPTSAKRSTNWINVTQLKSPAQYDVRVVAVSSPKYRTYSDEKRFSLGLISPLAVENAPIAGASATPLWLIVVICIVAAICLIVLIVCIVKKKRSRSANRYPVKEPPGNGTKLARPDEEKGLGSAPQSSKKEPDNRSATPATPNPLGTSSVSLISNPDRRLNDDDSDSESLDDDPDVTKFNEDGSFIGLYGPEHVTEDNVVDDDESRLLTNGTHSGNRLANGVGTTEVPNTQTVPV